MEKVGIVQPRLKSSHSPAAWKKGAIVEHHEKVVIAQQCEEGRHSAAVLKK